ncbi:unnamed protein product [Polarella glacialis]|uniref:Uncharacterized protein n=1 Tax=Polarella glacialis TaxID=89957 RepID=A0A813FXI8_POLGL|nr:unnamed protein product [Polarella glacialis]
MTTFDIRNRIHLELVELSGHVIAQRSWIATLRADCLYRTVRLAKPDHRCRLLHGTQEIKPSTPLVALDLSLGSCIQVVWIARQTDSYKPGNTAFAAIKANGSGSVVTWGDSQSGADSSAVAALLTEGVVQVVATDGAFAAMKANGICGNCGTFVARLSNGSVVTWGSSHFGGDSSKVAQHLTEGVVQVCGTNTACAALMIDGSVVTWGDDAAGGDSSGVALLLTEGVIELFSNYKDFVALKADGSVVTWGDDAEGGDSSEVAALLTEGVVHICGIEQAFAAIKARLKRKAAKLHRMADKMFVLKVSMQKLRGQIRAGVLALPTSSSGSGSDSDSDSEDTPTAYYAYTDTFLFKSTSVLLLAELDMIIELLSSEHFSELFAVQSSNGMWTGFVQFVRPRNIRRLNVVPFRNPFEWTEWNYSADEAFGQFCSIGYVHEWGVFE